MRTSYCKGRGKAKALLALFMFVCSAVSCYSPNLTSQIYRCDRGKCPEGLFCIDNVFCTQDTVECAGGGIEVAPGIAACTTAVTAAANMSPDPATLCKPGATVAKCNDMQVSKDLCAGITTNCDYCCN